MSRYRIKPGQCGDARGQGRAVWIAGLALGASIVNGCGKSEPEHAKPDDDKAAAPAPAVEAPKPPDVGMDLEAFVAARILEGCAARYGEPADEAKLLAIRQIAGLPHVAPVTAAALEALQARKGVPPADSPTGVMASERGRPGLAPDELKIQTSYEAAITKAAAWPEIARRVEDAVATCHYAEQVGLIQQERIASYIQAFVEVTCLGESTLGPDGKPDVIAHARAAAGIFRKIGLDARSFSQLGLVLGTFPDVTARIAEARSKACPDPRQAALHEASSGSFDGTMIGALQGTVTIEAHDGDAKATAVFAAGKGKVKVQRTLQLSGVLHGGRAHLQGGEGQDWLRFDAAPGSDGNGTWTGQIGFRTVNGQWSWKRHVDPAEAAAAAEKAVAEKAAAEAAAAKPAAEPDKLVDPAAATAGFPAADAPAPDPLGAAANPAGAPPSMPVVAPLAAKPSAKPSADGPPTAKTVGPDHKPGKPVAVPER